MSSRGGGSDVQALKLDVTNSADHAAAVKFIQDKFGKLDILVKINRELAAGLRGDAA